LSKRDSDSDSGTQDITDERPLKKRRLSSHDEDDMRQMQREIIIIKESVQRVEAGVREASITLRDLLHEMRQLL